MILQRAPYIEDHDTPVYAPLAEISLLGIHNNGEEYTTDDLYDDRDKLVAWESPLDLTPFENEYLNTYRQCVINISFEDIYANFKILDENGIEHAYMTDILITSNDPRYQIVVDSFFIFEFDENATLYDSEIFDVYPNNHLVSFYFGNYSDIYSEYRTLDTGSFLPLYYDDPTINETSYFDVFDSVGNWYYFDSQMFGLEEETGVYTLGWESAFAGEYYATYKDYVANILNYRYMNAEEVPDELAELYDYYTPHIDKFRYLYISWADQNAWEEWHTIEAPNVNISSLDIVFEWYDEEQEEYQSVSYDQSSGEFEARNIAVEIFYPYDKDSQTANFTLSQDYSEAVDLDTYKIEGIFFNENSHDFDPSNVNIYPSESLIEISAPDGFTLNDFEKIIVLLNFTEGAYSDYAQFRLKDDAINNHPEAPAWTKNDSLYVDFEYSDLDYFLLVEDYAVGAEDSLFEYIPYFRNGRFVRYDNVKLEYYVNMGEQISNFDNFTKVDDTRTGLELHDYDLDCEHELVIQKDDLTQDGQYDSFKYGYVNPAGEITFHTLIQEATSTELYTEKTGDMMVSEGFQIDWKDIWRNYYVYAKRYVTTNITTMNRVDTHTVLVQKDLDEDGMADKEVSFEAQYITTTAVTYTKEVTHLHFEPTVHNPTGSEHDGYLTEYRNSTYSLSDWSLSFVFRDFENDEVVSTRYYEDAFPNELSTYNDLDKYLVTITDDRGDFDPSNDITMEVPVLEDLLEISHPEDNVPAFFDYRIIVEDGEMNSTNILATTKQITIPSGLTTLSTINGRLTDKVVSLDVIEVIPDEGVYYDNAIFYAPDKIDGKYYYFDEDGDGVHSTIFVVNAEDEVLAVGFDYDGDSLFNPFKRLVVERHIIHSEPSGWSCTFGNITYYAALKYAGDKLISYQDTDKYDGMFAEMTYSDSLFDLWKLQFTSSSSRLMNEVKDLTHDQFMQMLTPKKITEDIWWQVKTQLIALAAGALAAYAAGAAYTAITHGAVLSSGWGTVIMILGYTLIYAAQTYFQSLIQERDLDYYIKSQTFHNVHYEGEETLSEKWWNDEYFGDTMPNTLQGSPRGVYTSVKVETDKHLYQGEIVLAPRNKEKTTMFGLTFVGVTLDYSQQTRYYVSCSDVDSRLDIYPFDDVDVLDVVYMKNNIMYLENAIHQATTENEDRHYDRVIPYMVSAVPTLQFADSTSSSSLPDFYEEYPIFVSASDYEQVQDQYHTIYKIYDEVTNEIQLIPEGSIHDLQSDIAFIKVYSVVKDSLDEDDIVEYLKEREPLYDLPSDAFTIDKNSGVLILDDTYPSVIEMNDNLQANREEYGNDAYIVLEVKVEKYRSLDDLGDLTSEQVEDISTMQFVHSKLLEYCYQYTMAKQTQERLDEIAYTTYITVTSCIIVAAVTSGASAILSAANAGSIAPIIERINVYALYKAVRSVFSEVLEELYIDPWIEAYIPHKTEEWGWDLWAQVLATTLVESLREALMGSATSVITQFCSHTDIMISSINQDVMMDMQENAATLKAQRLKQNIEVGASALSTVMLFAGAIIPGFSSSSFMSGLATAFTVGGMVVDDIGSMIASFLRKGPSQKGIAGGRYLLARLREKMINTKATDPRGKLFTLVSSKIIVPREETIEKVKEITESDTNVVRDWLSRHKKGVAVATYAMVGAISYVFPFVGAILSAVPALAIGMAKVGDSNAKMVVRSIWLDDYKIIRRLQANKENTYKICVKFIFNLINTINNELLYGILPKITQKFLRNIGLDLSGPKSSILRGESRALKPSTLRRLILKVESIYYNAYQDYGVDLYNSRIRLIKVLLDYYRFTKYLSRRTTISPKLKTPNTLYKRSLLIENLRQVFPKRYGILLSDEQLSRLIFKDSKKINEFLSYKPINTKSSTPTIEARIQPYQLLGIDFNVQGLKASDFDFVGIDVSKNELNTLKDQVSKIIKEFYFMNPFKVPYVKFSTYYGIPVSPEYWYAKYDLVRSVYFAASQDKGKAISFSDITTLFTSSVVLTDYLTTGREFGYFKLSEIKKIIGNFKNTEYTSILERDVNNYFDILINFRSRVIGDIAHHRLEYLTIKYLMSKGVSCTYELLLKKIDKTIKKGFHPDVLIHRGSEFDGLLHEQEGIMKLLGIQIPDSIRIITIDFTLASDDQIILDKTDRKYQGDDRFLFIVLYGKQDSETIDHLNQLIKRDGKRNVKVLSLEDYITFLGFTIDFYNEFKELSKKILKAFQNEDRFNEIMRLGAKWETQLRSLSYTKKAFIKYLGNLP